MSGFLETTEGFHASRRWKNHSDRRPRSLAKMENNSSINDGGEVGHGQGPILVEEE